MSDKKYCRLCKKKETRNQCGYGPKLFDKYSVDDATEQETAVAADESGISENDIKNFTDFIIEKSKSGDSSLRDWFGKSRSSDGKPGWVQLGGKYAGKPCAKQPGQTTKPKCGSSKMKRNLDKGEEESAFRRKQKEDPNPNRKGKAINVSTESNHMKNAPSIKDAKPKKKTKVKYDPDMKVMAPQIEEGHKNPESVKGIAKELDKAVEMHKSQAKRLRKSGVSEETIDEGVLDVALKTDKKVAELHKKVDNDVKRMKDGKKFKEEVTGGILVQDAGDFKPREIESVDIIKADPIKGGQLQELVRTKIQTGNMYQVIFGWRGKMMMVKLFFPDTAVPNRQKVADALNKMYPGSQLRSYSLSIVDYDDPYINVGEETILEKKEEEKYCRLCEKRETRGTCGYGPKMFDKFSVDNVSDAVKSSAASESDITEDMTGMSQKSGDKRSTDSGAGMTAKGVAKYNRRTGGNLKTAVTTPPSKLKAGSKAAGRRKSFCARSRSWKGERGLAARRRWNC